MTRKLPPRHPTPIPDKLRPIRLANSDPPNAPTNRPPLPPLLRRPDDGLDHQSLNSFGFAMIVYILCADIDTALLP